MAGKRLAVFEHDPAQMAMATRIGAQPVSSDVSNFAGKFNNGVVDVIAAPAVAYMPLEIYRGVGANGVALDMPVAQLTFQLLLRHKRFPEGFAARARGIFSVCLIRPCRWYWRRKTRSCFSSRRRTAMVRAIGSFCRIRALP